MTLANRPAERKELQFAVEQYGEVLSVPNFTSGLTGAGGLEGVAGYHWKRGADKKGERFWGLQEIAFARLPAPRKPPRAGN